MMRRTALPLLLLAACAWPALSLAQSWPSRPIRLVVPFTPGGTTDILARVVGQKTTEALAVQVLIDNRPGAAGIIGAEAVARAKPDGYTILLATNGILAVNASLYTKLPYDPVKDFAPITLVATVPSLLVVNPGQPIRSVKELIAVARAKPGDLRYGSSGTGGAPWMAVETLKLMAGVDIQEVPYKGAAPLTTDLIAGEIALTITGIPALISHVRSGKLRGLAVSSAKRSAAVPDLPTIAEAGLPGYEVSTIYGLFAPAGTPGEFIAKLHAAVSNGVRQPDVMERLSAEGAEPDGGPPEELARLIRAEIPRWAKVVKASGVKPQ